MQKFDKGDLIEGRLTGVDRVAIKGKLCTRYTVQLGSMRVQDGKVVAFEKFSPVPGTPDSVQFLGAHQIDIALSVEDRGKFVRIACTGEDESVRRGDNCMKLFDVDVWPTPIKWGPVVEASARPGSAEDLGITDDDIPF